MEVRRRKKIRGVQKKNYWILARHFYFGNKRPDSTKIER